MFYYWGFGLHLYSQIEFPELLTTATTNADVEICLENAPLSIDGSSFSSANFSYTINDHELLFIVKDVARYYACNGSRISIEILSASEEERTIRLYVLATVMAAILLQRLQLPLHASAIIKGDTLILLSGDSGAGKSTLLAELIKTGYRVFSDDVVVLKTDDTSSKVLATASYPMIKLWNDSIDKLSHDSFSNRSFKVRYDLDKYGFFFHSSFDTGSHPISKIVVLKKGEQDNFTLKELKSGEAFKAITKQVYRPMLIQSNRLRLLCFTTISELVKCCSVVEITRPRDCKPSELLAYAENHLLEENVYC